MIQPELWVDSPSAAIEFYGAAFGARVLHRAGAGDEIVAQLAVDGAAFWVTNTAQVMGRLSPVTLGGATCRFLLVVDEPDAVVEQAAAAGATVLSRVAEEHGWRVGRIRDPFGHEWEIGRPL
jgi:PhnB protein